MWEVFKLLMYLFWFLYLEAGELTPEWVSDPTVYLLLEYAWVSILSIIWWTYVVTKISFMKYFHLFCYENDSEIKFFEFYT